MQVIEIRDVKSVEDTPLLGRKCQLFVVRPLGETGVQNGEDHNAARTKCRDKIRVHRVFVNVELNPIHGYGSSLVLPLKGLSLPSLSFDVRVDLRHIGMIIRQCGMDLRQRQVAKFACDFFRNQSHGVPLSNPANGNSGPGNARSTAADFGTTRDQAANFSNRCHRLKHILLTKLTGRKNRAAELADITKHWHEWRKEWERNLAINETQFLRSVADLQSGFSHRSTIMEANFRDIAKAQHADFGVALARANDDVQKRLWADLDRIRTEYETIIHSELRSVRQKAFAAATLPPAAPKDDTQHPYDFLRFAERYRGPEQYVRRNFENYLGYFAGKTRVIDLGCGRGEMLELLKDNGIPVKGIDGDAESVAICRSKGLDAEEADLFVWLQAQPDGAHEVLFCSQVIEHLPPLELPGFIRQCAAKLEKGGVLILETPNPECLAIFATHFYLDPTHQRPVPPILAAFHMEEAGLGRIEVKRLAPAVDSMPSLASLPEDFRDAFFGCLDYAIIGRKL